MENDHSMLFQYYQRVAAVPPRRRAVVFCRRTSPIAPELTTGHIKSFHFLAFILLPETKFLNIILCRCRISATTFVV